MLAFDRSTLEAHAARVDGTLDDADPVWLPGDVLPSGAVHVTGRLSSAGDGRYFFSGRFEGAVATECRRCLAPVRAPVSEETRVLFAEAGDEAASDAETFQIEARDREIDLRPAIREQWLLAAPAYVLCREDCKGLCPRCGAELNAGPCDCPVETDDRWDALKALRSNG